MELVNETHRVIGNAVDKGLRDNMPPAEMVSKLQNDTFVFSACKTHIELKEVSLKLIDGNGKIQSFQKFSQYVMDIHKQYNENYLQAEYIFATSSAEMAAKWVDVEKDGDRYNLQYRTAQDDRVRDAHRAIAGTTLPASDPFWNSYYPPNGWRCRCNAVQVLKEKYPTDNSIDKIKLADGATTQIDSKGRDRNAMFMYNPGKQQVIFPPKHPYYKVQQGIHDIISGLMQNSVSKETAKKDLIAWCKENLPKTQIGKFTARRFEITREDLETPVIVNSNFYNEIISKYKSDKNYSLKLDLSKKAHHFIRLADFKFNEEPKHVHANTFKVYHYNHEEIKLELKCKVVNDGIFLYYMRILK